MACELFQGKNKNTEKKKHSSTLKEKKQKINLHLQSDSCSCTFRKSIAEFQREIATKRDTLRGYEQHKTYKLCKKGNKGSKTNEVTSYFGYDTKNSQISDAKSMLRILRV